MRLVEHSFTVCEHLNFGLVTCLYTTFLGQNEDSKWWAQGGQLKASVVGITVSKIISEDVLLTERQDVPESRPLLRNSGNLGVPRAT